MKEKRRGNVVRQVADDAQAGWEAREIELERVGTVDGQLERRKARRQLGGEIAIDFDGLELAGALDERRGERALAGADLDQKIARRGSDGVDDARSHARVMQEMLPEPLTGSVRGRWQA